VWNVGGVSPSHAEKGSPLLVVEVEAGTAKQLQMVLQLGNTELVSDPCPPNSRDSLLFNEAHLRRNGAPPISSAGGGAHRRPMTRAVFSSSLPPSPGHARQPAADSPMRLGLGKTLECGIPLQAS